MYNEKYAGFWKRLGAFLIDQIILGAVHMFLIMPVIFFYFIDSLPFSEQGESVNFVNIQYEYYYSDEFALSKIFFFIVTIGVLSLFINWLYYAILESSRKQASIGKMVLSIKVTDSLGERITFGRASGRYFAKIISGMIFMVGYIMAAFTEKKQALHDILANCLVINALYIDYNQFEKQNEATNEVETT